MATAMQRAEVPIDGLEVSAYTVPTDRPESDGTLAWDSTTIVVVEVAAGGERGLGYTYADASAAQVIDRRLRQVVEGADATAGGAPWGAMLGPRRDRGPAGIAARGGSAGRPGALGREGGPPPAAPLPPPRG